MTQACDEVDPGQLERLSRFVGPLLVELETKKERRLASDYVLGLLGPAERKTVQPMIRTMRGVDEAPSRERRMTEMLADGEWNHRSLTLQGAQRLVEAFPSFEAYTLDDTSCLRQGSDSVGVANQYAGCVGGLTNSQAIVTAGVASEHVSSLIAAQLYLPESWCTSDAAARRAKCRVPATVRLRTKTAIGLDIVRDVAAWGLPKLPWLCDSAYGDSAAFRHALAEAGETFVVGASMALTVWPVGTTFALQKRPEGAGRPPVRLFAERGARPMTIAALAATLPSTAWQNVLWRQGSRGPQRGRFAAIRVRPARGLCGKNAAGTIRPEDLQPEQWLLIYSSTGRTISRSRRRHGSRTSRRRPTS